MNKTKCNERYLDGGDTIRVCGLNKGHGGHCGCAGDKPEWLVKEEALAEAVR